MATQKYITIPVMSTREVIAGLAMTAGSPLKCLAIKGKVAPIMAEITICKPRDMVIAAAILVMLCGKSTSLLANIIIISKNEIIHNIVANRIAILVSLITTFSQSLRLI